MTATAIGPRPGPGRVRPFQFPEYEELRLPSGLRVLLCDLPGQRLVAAELVTEGGAVNEEAAEQGVANLAARSLMEGTEARDAFAIADFLDRRGARLSSSSSADIFQFHADAPARYFPDVLELLAEVILRPAFPADEVKRIRDMRVNELRQSRTEPFPRASEEFIDRIYPRGSRYRSLAFDELQVLPSLDRDAVAAYYGRLVTPGSATLVIAGDFSSFDAESSVRRLLGGWSAPEPERPEVVIDTTPRPPALVFVDRPGAVQSSLIAGHIGVPRSDPDFIPLQVMLHILGGGSLTTRMNLKLREEKGYTYGAGAFNEFRRKAGPFAAATSVETPVTAPALADMVGELERMKRDGATVREVEDARNFLAGSWSLGFQSSGGFAGALVDLVVHGLDRTHLDTYRERINAVSVEEVARVADRLIDIDHMTMVVVGDAEKVGGEVEATGLAPFERITDTAPATA